MFHFFCTPLRDSEGRVTLGLTKESTAGTFQTLFSTASTSTTYARDGSHTISGVGCRTTIIFRMQYIFSWSPVFPREDLPGSSVIHIACFPFKHSGLTLASLITSIVAIVCLSLIVCMFSSIASLFSQVFQEPGHPADCYFRVQTFGCCLYIYTSTISGGPMGSLNSAGARYRKAGMIFYISPCSAHWRAPRGGNGSSELPRL